MEAEKMCTSYLIALVQRMATRAWDGSFMEETIPEKVHWKRNGREAGHASPMLLSNDSTIR
jgi:hypothetical protein